MKKVVFSFLGVMIFTSPAFSTGYGDAGCGLGSIIIGDESGPVQILAATLNGVSYNQVFGVSSGTSNCDPDGIVLAEQERHRFVVQNFASLEKEMASGGGEHIRTLASLLGCPSEKRVQFISYTQQNYESIFENEKTTPKEMLNTLRKGLSTHPELTASCVS